MGARCKGNECVQHGEINRTKKMAEKSTVTYEAVMSSLKKGNYAPIYLLMGDEPYFIDSISNYIQQNALSEAEQGFNQTVVFGADITVGQIIDMAMSYPMMAARRVVIVKEAQGVKQLDKLFKYVEKPQSTTVLVLCYKNGTADKRQKWVSAVARNGVLYESVKMKDWQLPGYVKKWMLEKKATIDDKSASMIAEFVGADLHRLVSELEKLLVVLPEDRRVTPELVEEHVGVSKDFNGFELRDAIVNRDVYKANLIMKYFTSSQKRDSLYIVLPSLYSFFQNLMIAHYVPNRNDPDALAAALGLRSKYGTQSYLVALKNYTAMKTLLILDKIGKTDAKMKGLDNPNTPVSQLMQELIHYILH